MLLDFFKRPSAQFFRINCRFCFFESFVCLFQNEVGSFSSLVKNPNVSSDSKSDKNDRKQKYGGNNPQ